MFTDKRDASAFVIRGRKEEYIYAKNTATLSPTLVTKVTQMPESGPGYHVVIAQFKDKTIAGLVLNCENFETDEELPAGEILDILKND